MDSQLVSENPRWFILNHVGASSRDTAKKAVDGFNASQGRSLELFAPTYVVKVEKNGETRMKTASLTFHYVFVRGLFSEVKALCGLANGFSFLIDRAASERYATVSDREMASFKNIARAYKNCLPYFPLDDVDLEEGDLVEVVRGDFPGLVGTYMPNAKSRTGNIVLHIYNNTGTIAFNVKATDVRVLEFSHKSTRANDQIDAFVPHLLKALRHHSLARSSPLTFSPSCLFSAAAWAAPVSTTASSTPSYRPFSAAATPYSATSRRPLRPRPDSRGSKTP